jgi:hypothetical protein
MARYRVTVSEVWQRVVIVSAEDEAEAIEKVACQLDVETQVEEKFEFSHLDPDGTMIEPA